jgi:protein-tyrosine phosphatase
LVEQGNGTMIHCRGGIGRAGLITGMLLKDLGVFKEFKKCLEHL